MQNCRPLAAARPKFYDADFGRGDWERVVGVAAAGEKSVEMTG
jgi:hypothetical protein